MPKRYKRGFQIEIALNYFAKQTTRGMGFALIRGTHHHIKEKKYGLSLGLARRLGMIGDVVAISFRLYVVRTLAGVGSRLLGRARASRVS